MIFSQIGMFGGEEPVQGASLNDKVDWILSRYPETRGNDALLVVRCWQHFDGLEIAIGKAALANLIQFATRERTASPETYCRRRRETQMLRQEEGHLRPDEGVVDRRRRRDGAGPPGNK